MEAIVFPKSFDEIQKPVIAEAGTYGLILAKAYLKDNKNKNGKNLVLELVISGEGGPPDGVGLTEYLPLPNKDDTDKKTRQGQSMTDWKMSNIKKYVEALGGECLGNGIEGLAPGCQCTAKIGKTSNDNGDEYNQIDGPLMSMTQAS